jgi:predicted Fe-S protein YdhL (DUF1289 family)
MSVAEQAVAAPPVPTPCIGVCKMDEASGLCTGCARTGDEVAAWQDAGADYKLRVWRDLPARRAGAGVSCYRLPWSADEIGAVIERSLRRRWGRWVLGLDGASASFEIGANEDAEIVSRADVIAAVTARGAMRLAKHAKTVAVAFGDGHDGKGPEAVGLVLPRVRVALRKGAGLAKAGLDAEAVMAGREAQLYDLGVAAEAAARFCLRTDHTPLIAALDGMTGTPWRDALAKADALIDAAHPHSIAETGLGRIEVFSRPISGMDRGTRAELTCRGPMPSAELPSGWTLPTVFAPCALFYPRVRKPTEALLDGRF